MMNESKVKVYPFFFSQLESKLHTYRSYLSSEEMALVNKKVTLELQNRQIVSRGCLREVLSKELQIAPKQLKLEATLNGKPFLPDFPNFFFNVSHSKELLVIAVSTKEIGIDIEFKSTPFNEKTILTFMSLQECELFSSLTLSSEKRNFFYQVWTAKESLSKLYGLGLNIDFQKLNITLDNSKQFFCDEYFTFGEFIELKPDYALALCQKDQHLHYEIIS